MAAWCCSAIRFCWLPYVPAQQCVLLRPLIRGLVACARCQCRVLGMRRVRSPHAPTACAWRLTRSYDPYIRLADVMKLEACAHHAQHSKTLCVTFCTGLKCSVPMLKALCTPMTGGGPFAAPVMYGDIGGEPRPRGPATRQGTPPAPGRTYTACSRYLFLNDMIFIWCCAEDLPYLCRGCDHCQAPRVLRTTGHALGLQVDSKWRVCTMRRSGLGGRPDGRIALLGPQGFEESLWCAVCGMWPW